MQHAYHAIAIIALKVGELKIRDKLITEGRLGGGFDLEMEGLLIENTNQLNEIIDKIGYPTIHKVGEEASKAAWLIIQHSISTPSFMIKCVNHLRVAVLNQEAHPIQLAYLTDRIAVFQDEPQLYGTQFDWNENGLLSPNGFDDLQKVNQRRNDLSLNSLSEQTLIIRKRAKEENHKPPSDPVKRKIDYDNWRKKVGWIK